MDFLIGKLFIESLIEKLLKIHVTPDGLILKKMKKSQILSKSDDLFLDG